MLHKEPPRSRSRGGGVRGPSSSTSPTRRRSSRPRTTARSPGSPTVEPSDEGIRFGEKAAKRLIALRADDGRGASVQFTKPPAPGVCARPPDELPFFQSVVREDAPTALKSYDQFRPGPPPKLIGPVRDFNEVEAARLAHGLGGTEKQTETALFFSDTTIGPLHGRCAIW